MALALADKAEDVSEKTQAKSNKELELKDLMPEKSLFGPSAQDMAFSFDGRYGAYLHRTYPERRHGNDLFLYDIEKDEIRRVTWPSVMARYQQKAREVVEDRQEKAKKAEKKSDSEKKEAEAKPVDAGTPQKAKDADLSGEDSKKAKALKRQERRRKKKEAQQEKNKEQKGEETRQGGDGKKDVEQQEDDEEARLKKRGDWVSDKDADDEKAPKYDGISHLAWSPRTLELLFVSGGDIYRYNPAEDVITRLTQTRSREYEVAWLQDGSGFTFRRDSALFRYRMDDGPVRQLDPQFPAGQSLHGYRLSPDGRTLAFLTDKETVKPESSKVEIASYRDRLMKAKEVTRHVSDDKLAVREKRIYLYRLSDADDEKEELIEVYMGKTEMPDDMVKTPVWSPDSQKIAFVVFQQEEGLVRLFEAKVPPEKEADEAETAAADPNNEPNEVDHETQEEPEEKETPGEAREIFRFLHHGGPNTPRMMTCMYLADNRRLVYLSEQTGFRHLQLLDPLYESWKSLTRGAYEVYPLGISEDRRWVFFESTQEHPAQLDLYRLDTETEEVVRLTRDVGRHTGAAVSQDGTRVLTNLVSYEQLQELLFIDTQTGRHRILTDSHPEKAHTFAEPTPEFFDFNNRLGHRLYGMMFKPESWQATDRRPVLIYFYGGPLGTRKMVMQGSFSPYNYAFPYYMAEKHGYVACTVDTRGNSGYAGVFEKANFGQVGKPQVEDLVDAVDYLVENHGVDPNRIGIHGWSFGGFQTQMCLYTEPNVFQVGIAGAGPTEWENYNSWYTRHTIGKSEPGEATLKAFSLLPLAKHLKGHLLLVHGMEDSNVLYQDTVRVYRELLKAGKETRVELFLDPTGGHGLGGDVNTLSRYRKYESFLLRTLGSGLADPNDG
jgi:dipeptidyl aminopeptidase/acylaminoacyl peptidase